MEKGQTFKQMTTEQLDIHKINRKWAINAI